MKERNVDKIKRLEKELAAEREKRHNADLEIMRMHKVVDHTRKEAVDQLREISIAADAWTTAVTMAHGSQAEDGSWTLTVPVYAAGSLYERFRVSVSRDVDTYSAKVVQRGQEDGVEPQ